LNTDSWHHGESEKERERERKGDRKFTGIQECSVEAASTIVDQSFLNSRTERLALKRRREEGGRRREVMC